MKITVFTSNQPRHVSLIRQLANIADELFVVMECTTLFPGAVKDSIYNQSPVMKEYFEHVTAAEQKIFGAPGFTPGNVRILNLKMGDVSQLPLPAFKEAIDADAIIVFGASYIKGLLAEALVKRRAVNIHMGVSPYYRGSSCNFWAMYDGHPELVGATIHLLSRGLDSGDMLFHALPKPMGYEPFALGMKAVEAAHIALAQHIENRTLQKLEAVKQDKTQQIRLGRYTDFNDAVAAEYLQRLPTPEQVGKMLKENQGKHTLLKPVYC